MICLQSLEQVHTSFGNGWFTKNRKQHESKSFDPKKNRGKILLAYNTSFLGHLFYSLLYLLRVHMVDQMGHALVQDVQGPLGSQVLDINLVVVMGIYPATPRNATPERRLWFFGFSLSHFGRWNKSCLNGLFSLLNMYSQKVLKFSHWPSKGLINNHHPAICSPDKAPKFPLWKASHDADLLLLDISSPFTASDMGVPKMMVPNNHRFSY